MVLHEQNTRGRATHMEADTATIEWILRDWVEHGHELVGGGGGTGQETAILASWQQHPNDVLKQHHQWGQCLSPSLHLPASQQKQQV